MKKVEIEYINGNTDVEWFGKTDYIKGYSLTDKKFELNTCEMYGKKLTTRTINLDNMIDGKLNPVMWIRLYHFDQLGDVKGRITIYQRHSIQRDLNKWLEKVKEFVHNVRDQQYENKSGDPMNEYEKLMEEFKGWEK
jgi:hypothetical protein